MVTDCGYTSFNPGQARCIDCKRQWPLGLVESRACAVEMFADIYPNLKKIEKAKQALLGMLETRYGRLQVSKLEQFGGVEKSNG